MNSRRNRARFLAAVLPFAVAFVAAFKVKTIAAQKVPTTTYYKHGRIYTNDPANPWAEAFAVSQGRITCVGKMDHVLMDCGGGQEGAGTVHLNGQFVRPGFN